MLVWENIESVNSAAHIYTDHTTRKLIHKNVE